MTTNSVDMILKGQKTSKRKTTTYLVFHGAKDIKLRRKMPFSQLKDAIAFAKEKEKTVHVNIYKEVKETSIAITEI